MACYSKHLEFFETWRLHHFGFINGCIQVVDKDRFSLKGNHFSNIAGHDTEKPVKAWLRQSGSKVLCKPNDSVSIEHSSQIFCFLCISARCITYLGKRMFYYIAETPAMWIIRLYILIFHAILILVEMKICIPGIIP